MPSSHQNQGTLLPGQPAEQSICHGRGKGRSTGNATYPHVLVLENHHTLGLLNEVVRQGRPLHNVLQLVCLPRDSELNVALELAPGQTHLAWNLATAVAGPAAGEGEE